MAKTPFNVYKAIASTTVVDQAEQTMRPTTSSRSTTSAELPSVKESADVVPEPMLASSPVVSSTAAAVGTQDALLVLRPAWDDVNMTIRRAKESMVPFGKKLQDNIAQGNVGERGEEWVLAQGTIILCVALGTIPVVGGAVTLLAGPGLLLAGLLVMFAGATGLGDSLSPWPAPVKDNELTTTGIYGVIRHPLYSGLVMSTLGFGVVTGSPLRMLLGILLALLLDQKADKEEKLLVDKHGEAYETYCKEVAKFVPRLY